MVKKRERLTTENTEEVNGEEKKDRKKTYHRGTEVDGKKW